MRRRSWLTDQSHARSVDERATGWTISLSLRGTTRGESARDRLFEGPLMGSLLPRSRSLGQRHIWLSSLMSTDFVALSETTVLTSWCQSIKRRFVPSTIGARRQGSATHRRLPLVGPQGRHPNAGLL